MGKTRGCRALLFIKLSDRNNKSKRRIKSLQPDAADQFIKTRVNAQGIQSRFDIQHNHLTLVLLKRFVQIFKRLFLFTQQRAIPCYCKKIASGFTFIEFVKL